MTQATLFPLTPPNIFARHETFHPRFGWLKKGFDQAVKNPQVFLAEDATVQLGVGKNMVRSIRYWCRVFKLLDKHDQPTPFGQQLLTDSGWDTYIEDPATLWLLHWKLLEVPCQATAWQLIFDQLRASEFTQEELFHHLNECTQGSSGRIADSSLKKDVGCLLRMYVAQTQKKKSTVAEDNLDCPFSELGLMHTAGVSHRYTFRIGHKPTLPAEIIVYSCLRHACKLNESTNVSFASLLYDSGSPGLAFKLREQDISQAIEQVARRHKALSISDAAGKLQFFFESQPEQLATDILNAYYTDR